MICTKPLLSSNVRIKRARRSPEILILHHVCDRWSRVDHRSMASKRLPPNHRRCRSLVWVAPPKFDGVYMRFELASPMTRSSIVRATPIHLQLAIFEDFVQTCQCFASSHRLRLSSERSRADVCSCVDADRGHGVVGCRAESSRPKGSEL